MAKKPVRKAVKKKVAKKTVKKAVRKKVVRKAAKKAIKKKVAKKAVKKATRKVVKKAVKKAAPKKVAKKVTKKKIARKPAQKRKAKSGPLKPLPITIYILGIEPDGQTLILSDNGESTAAPGALVTWVVDIGSGVKIINEIFDDGLTPPLFSPKPKPIPHSLNWEAKVNPSITNKQLRHYSIRFTPDFSGALPTLNLSDPKIQVNP